jgi:hypothetical protein
LKDFASYIISLLLSALGAKLSKKNLPDVQRQFDAFCNTNRQKIYDVAQITESLLGDLQAELL